jgi:hypothetical protein
MPGPFDAAGTIHDPTRYAALTPSAEQFAGLRTQRCPYSDGISSYLMRRFYSGIHFDQMLDGLNREITVNLTDKRRPGSVVYNSNTFAPSTGYYSFKFIQDGQEVVRVMYDTATAVYDATAGQKTLIWTKSAGAGRTRFLSVGTTLYMGNGVDSVKWVRSSKGWKASTLFATGSYIVDSNNNLQEAMGAQTATITGIQVKSNVATVFFSSLTQLQIQNGVKLTFAGLTTIPALNGTSQAVTAIANNLQASFSYTHADLALGPETGTATTGNGTTNTTQPTWAAGLGAITADAGEQWLNRGSSVQQWAYPGPASAPTVTQALAPTLYQQWAANTWYAPLFVILVSGVLYQLTQAGVTAGSTPSFSATIGAVTNDGTAKWTSLGLSGWVANTIYNVGAVIQATFTYYITVPVYTTTYTWNGYVNVPTVTVTYEQQAVTVTCIFQATTTGTTGPSTPSWTNGLGTTVTDNSVGWVNMGNAAAYMGASAAQTLSLATSIIDTNNNLETAQQLGESGATAPTTWNDFSGGATGDGTLLWLNKGPYASASTGAWVYAYSGLDSISGEITTASSQSAPIIVQANNLAVIQGNGMATAFDQIIVWRTVMGGSVLMYDSQIPNPGPNSTWIFTDTTPDLSLNAFIAAPVASSNNPPPTGLTGMVYHDQRTWGFVDNLVYDSGGPDTLVGNGNTAWPPLNFIAFPGKVVKLRVILVQNGGVLVYTTNGIWLILGTGTSSNPYYSAKYCEKVNLGGYDAEDMIGSDIYMMESNGCVSNLKVMYPFDPQSGYSEVGLPIGDQFLKVTTGGISSALYTPATAFLSWNITNTKDKAMYLADGAVGWFRMGAVSPPESGLVWSPWATITGGTSAVQSVETAPGVFNLLIGPPTGGGPILMRDTTGTYWDDNGTAYPAWDVKGAILLCSTGQQAEVAWIAIKSAAVGARPVLSVLMGEIAATANTPWTVLQATSPDPADQAPSQTVFSDRYSGQQGAGVSSSDSVLVKFDYGSQAAADELLEFAIYGAKVEERKQ